MNLEQLEKLADAEHLVVVLPAQTVKQLIALIRQCKDAMNEVSGLINHQYSGTSTAMTDLQYASDYCGDALLAIEAWEKE